MRRRRKHSVEDPFVREDFFTTQDGKTITSGDIIKIKGVWGSKFRFYKFVTNPETGVSWVDCVELERGVACGMRSFYPERVKPIPKKRGKRVKRSRQTP